MAMEERQRQIVEGAGRDDSRLNKEFIEMLEKYGFYIVLGVAVIVGSYALYQYYQRQQAAARDSAYVSFNAAAVAQNPDQLSQLGTGDAAGTAIPMMAAQMAADIHLSASRTGIPIGEKLSPDGKLPEGKSFLTDEQRAAELAKAEELYKSALAKSNGSAGQENFALAALTGLASIAEDRGKMDEATSFYNQAIAKAESLKFDALVTSLKDRVASLPTLSAPKLLSSADLPNANPVNPTIVPMGNFQGITSDGQAIEMPPPTFTNPDGTTVTPQPINITPAPAPAPTPAPADAPKSEPAPATPPATPPADPAKPG